MPRTIAHIIQSTPPKIPGRVHEHLKRIRGEDGKISSREEALAMLEYLPRATVVFTDNKDAIPLAYMEARNFLERGNGNLGTDIESLFNKGIEFLKKKYNEYGGTEKLLAFFGN